MTNHFAAALQRHRTSRHLSQGDLAQRTGLQPSAISHFEKGRRSPSLSNLTKLADALGVSLDELAGRKIDHAIYHYTPHEREMLSAARHLSYEEAGLLNELLLKIGKLKEAHRGR